MVKESSQIYKMRPATLYGLKLIALTKIKEAKLKILQFPLGVTRRTNIRNECIRGRKIEQFGHVHLIGQKMLNMELPGRTIRGETTERINGCNEGGHADAWCGRRGC